MRWRFGHAAAVMALTIAPTAHSEGPVRLYAAGSLKAVMGEIVAAFRAQSGISVEGTFGASGLLRDRIAKGEPAEIFASANMEHPQSLTAAGRAGPVAAFALNQLCALAGAKVDVASETLLARMLDPAIKLGTSTPKADPSGDYAWALFAKAEALRKGAFAALTGKALTLTGGPNSPPPPERSVYAKLVGEEKADIFLTYCTNAVLARKEVPALKVVRVPDDLAVGAQYGVTTIAGAGAGALAFVTYLRTPMARAILVRHGFGLPPL